MVWAKPQPIVFKTKFVRTWWIEAAIHLCHGQHIFFFCWNEGLVSNVLCKNIFVTDLLGIQHLLEILQTSLIFKNSENVVKSGCFKNICNGQRQFLFEMKERYKVSYVKMLMFCKIIRWLVFIWNIAHLIQCEN